MKLKRKEIYALANAHENIKGSGRKFAYVISKNKERLDREVKEMEKYKDPSDEYQAFLDALEDARKEYAKKDANGKPMTSIKPLPNGQQRVAYDIPNFEDPKSPFRVAVTKLEKKHKKDIEDHENKLKDFVDKFLEEEIDFRILRIHWDDLPEAISTDQMFGILPLVDGVPEEFLLEEDEDPQVETPTEKPSNGKGEKADMKLVKDEAKK